MKIVQDRVAGVPPQENRTLECAQAVEVPAPSGLGETRDANGETAGGQTNSEAGSGPVCIKPRSWSGTDEMDELDLATHHPTRLGV